MITIENEGEGEYEQLRLEDGTVLFLKFDIMEVYWCNLDILTQSDKNLSILEALQTVGPEWHKYMVDRAYRAVRDVIEGNPISFQIRRFADETHRLRLELEQGSSG